MSLSKMGPLAILILSWVQMAFTRECARLAFGPESQFEKYLGYKVAAFEAPGYGPRDELTYAMYTEVGQQVSRFTMRGDRTMFLFIFKDESLGPENKNVHAQKALLRKRFGRSGGMPRRY